MSGPKSGATQEEDAAQAPEPGAACEPASRGLRADEIAEPTPVAEPARYTDTNLPQAGDVIAERYRIESELGRGGMAVVYAATQLTGGRRVALKWMFEGRSHRDERRRRFLREARAAGSIQHPNVVRVHDAGEHASGVFLVMELVEGQALSDYLKERGPMSAAEATDLLMPALRGIDAAHRKGIVHRDLKPENLYVCKRERNGQSETLELKVLDFGLSKLVGPAVDSLHTLPGMLIGTPQYMSPEQADHRIGKDAKPSPAVQATRAQKSSSRSIAIAVIAVALAGVALWSQGRDTTQAEPKPKKVGVADPWA